MRRRAIVRKYILVLSSALFCLHGENWVQWGQNPQHSSFANLDGQNPAVVEAAVRFDPFVDDVRRDYFGVLPVRYSAPLIDRDDVFMMFKTGTYVSCRSGIAPCGEQLMKWEVERLRLGQ